MISPEQAMKAAREAAAPTIERITKIVDTQLAKYVGVGSITIEVPIKLKGKGTAKPTEVLPFMVEDVVREYQKPTDTGSRWEIVSKPNSSRKVDGGEETEEIYNLLFTPFFPPPPNPAEH